MVFGTKSYTIGASENPAVCASAILANKLKRIEDCKRANMELQAGSVEADALS
jgi:hypothetical protein